MNKVRTLIMLILILGVNIIVLSIKNPLLILFIFIGIVLISIRLTSPVQTMGRLKLFVGIGISIFIFQILFLHNINITFKFIQSFRVTLQLFMVSEVVRIGVFIISPASLISLFSFLPKNIQLLIGMTFYFIPLSIKEYGIISQIQTSRGFGNSIKSKILSPIACIIPLLHRVFQRAETISLSIISRGWEDEK